MTTVLSRWKLMRTPPPAATVDPAGARRAAHHARCALEAERTRARLTTALGESLRELRERNHFADLIEAHYLEGRNG